MNVDQMTSASTSVTSTTVTFDFLMVSYKSTTLCSFCGALGIKKSGNKDTRSQRIIEHVQLHVVNWVPPTPPDKRRHVNEPDLTPLPLVPMLSVHKQWGTAGDLVPSSISGTTVTTPETSGATEQVVDQPDSRSPFVP